MSHLYDQSPLGKGFSGDLFGRLKISQPYTLFDSSHRYSQDGDFTDLIIGEGSISGIITAQSTATLGIGATVGCSYIRESKRVFSYQPGKSLQVFQTFVLNPPKENLVQRVGYASSENGIMLELDGNQVNIIKRTAVTGIGETISISQSEWNQDKLDGTGPSGYTLDLTKAQILFTEYEWLGVGSVRVGFAIDGKFIIAHQFDHANHIDSTYMTTATLPIRYEILNTGPTTSPSVMKQICASVLSNGGYERLTKRDIARRTTVVSVGSTNFVPLVSVRLTPGREDSIILPKSFSFLGSSSNTALLEVAWIRNGTLSNPTSLTWESLQRTQNAQKNTNATSITGGSIVLNDFVSSANKSDTPLNVESNYNWDLQLGRTQTKVSDILTLAVRAVTGAADCIGSISLYDLT